MNESKLIEIQKLNYECVFCFIRMFQKLLYTHSIPESLKNQITSDFIDFIAKIDFNQKKPEIARKIHLIIQGILQDKDPYKIQKQEMNEKAKALLPYCLQQIQQSENAFETACKVAIAGNIIDFAASPDFDIEKTLHQVLNSDFAINHTDVFMHEVEKSETILYLGDNAGEIVFDTILLQYLQHKNVYYAVRGSSIINDATQKDADFAGVNKFATVINNGYDAPSTILEKCSNEFLSIYNKADIVISKGQGNLEGLFAVNDKPIFFLLMVKCRVISHLLDVDKGQYVLFYNKK